MPAAIAGRHHHQRRLPGRTLVGFDLFEDAGIEGKDSQKAAKQGGHDEVPPRAARANFVPQRGRASGASWQGRAGRNMAAREFH